jgi:Flp pilus assembly protein TadG
MRTSWRRLRAAGGERGAGGQSLELLLLVPAVLVLFAVMVAVGRYQLGTSKIDQAAGAAARAASLQGTAAAAQPAAQSAATASLDGAGITCQNISVIVDTSAFTAGAGPGAAVQVSVTCTVQWSDLSIPGWPGQKTITSTASSPLDLKRIGT